MDEKSVPSCIRGYHIYKDIHVWTATIGEELVCRREPTNSKDRYAVSVMKEENIIGHVPRR